MKIIIDTIEDNKNDVAAVLAVAYKSHNEKVDEVIEKEKKKTKKKTTKKKKEADAETDNDTISKNDVKKALEAYKEENGMKGVKKILNKYGANLSEVDPDDYPDLVADLALD